MQSKVDINLYKHIKMLTTEIFTVGIFSLLIEIAIIMYTRNMFSSWICCKAYGTNCLISWFSDSAIDLLIFMCTKWPLVNGRF